LCGVADVKSPPIVDRTKRRRIALALKVKRRRRLAVQPRESVARFRMDQRLHRAGVSFALPAALVSLAGESAVPTTGTCRDDYRPTGEILLQGVQPTNPYVRHVWGKPRMTHRIPAIKKGPYGTYVFNEIRRTKSRAPTTT